MVVQALGQEHEASESFDKALRLVQDVERQNQDFPAVVGKCKGLLSFLESRLSPVQ